MISISFGNYFVLPAALKVFCAPISSTLCFKTNRLDIQQRNEGDIDKLNKRKVHGKTWSCTCTTKTFVTSSIVNFQSVSDTLDDHLSKTNRHSLSISHLETCLRWFMNRSEQFDIHGDYLQLVSNGNDSYRQWCLNLSHSDVIKNKKENGNVRKHSKHAHAHIVVSLVWKHIVIGGICYEDHFLDCAWNAVIFALHENVELLLSICFRKWTGGHWATKYGKQQTEKLPEV